MTYAVNARLRKLEGYVGNAAGCGHTLMIDAAALPPASCPACGSGDYPLIQVEEQVVQTHRPALT